MASSATGQSLLTALPARPPTPPREANAGTVDISVESMPGLPLPSESQSSLQTPPNISTPSSAATESDSNSTRLRKKVGWSTHTDYKDPPQYREGHRTYKSSPLSSSLSKPVKGILKPSSSPIIRPSPLGDELHGPASQARIAEMLDSTIKQLAGSDRDSKLDAYMMLARALKASNNLPDRVALQDKMSLFMQFIQRDVTSKNESGLLDSSLVNHALSLLVTFLHFPAIASRLTSDFGIFITEHSIRSFQDSGMPKDVIRHLMQVMAFQTFSSKAMTLDRVGRLVTAIHNIEDHVTGKGIIMGRIQIYKKLVKQSQSCMAAHPDWLKDVLTDMLSTVKDIRTQAITLGMEAGFALRSDKHFMRKAIEILQTTSDDGQTYIKFYIRRLEEMIRDKSAPAAVPQIWSVVTLLLRCPPDRWEYFNPWLKLAQDAFNSSEGKTRQEANYAWSRYIYLCLADGKLTPKALSILSQPLASQLRRKSPSKPSEEVSKLRGVVIGAICTLLYYGFKPSDNKYPQDLIWDAVVQPIVAQLSNTGDRPDPTGDNIMHASRILVGLLDASTPRVWREDRIMDQSLANPEELPPVDPKWVRRSSPKIFQAVGPILEKRFLDLAKTETLTYRLWQALVGSVAAASRKDIKVSEDTARFFALSFGVLSRVWTDRASSGENVDKLKLYSSVQRFIKVLFDGLGMLAFTEKKLSISLPHAYEPATTPSHHPSRSSKDAVQVRAPLHHLFLMLSSVPQNNAHEQEHANFFLAVFEPFFHGKSNKFRHELARELLDLLPRSVPSATGPWILAAKYIGGRLDTESSNTAPNSHDQPLGPVYRDVVNLLERGIISQPEELDQRWIEVFDLVSKHSVETFGDAGRGLVVVEPLARFLCENYTDTSASLKLTVVQVSRMLFEAAKLPRDQQALQNARRRLWGTPPTVNPITTVDIFDHLYKLGRRTLADLYNGYAQFKATEAIAAYVQTLCTFLETCLDRSEPAPLLKLQTGLCLWLQDEKALLQLSGASPILQTVQHFWGRICVYIANQCQANRPFLDEMEPLLTAAFKSQHHAIVAGAVETWNKLSKEDEEVDCSPSLKSVVSSLHSKAGASGNTASNSSGNFGAQAMPFFGVQADMSFAISSAASSSHAGAKASVEGAPGSKALLRSASSKKRRKDSAADLTPTRRSKRKSTARLRHEDSQIQFASIASSSPDRESQHLTEHQKEVRERQRDAAAMFTELKTSSPGQSAQRTTRQSERRRTDSKDNQEASTPKRAASYEELISSTPTPRRGQPIHLDELNDPPSSPPELRPYPLLSEIQSRSRASTSLEHWEFSSPPTSPVTSRQRVVHEVELPHVTLTNDTTQPQVQSQDSRVVQDSEEAQVIPSSFDIDFASKPGSESEAIASGRRRSTQTGPIRRPATPPSQQQSIPRSDVQETPKSADEEFVDARSSPELTLPELPMTRAQLRQMRHAKESTGASTTTKGNNEGNSTAQSHAVDGDSLAKGQRRKVARECIRVHTDSSPSPTKEEGVLERSASPEAPPPAVDETADSHKKESRRKRKRGGAKASESRRKKRRSEDRDALQPIEATILDVEKQSSPLKVDELNPREAVGVQTRRSAKKRQLEEEEEAANSLQDDLPVAAEAEGGDTDEELMSQLVTESEAASQSQSQADAPNSIEESTPGLDTRPRMPKRRRSGRQHRISKEEKAGNAQTAQIIKTLRSGLDVLRDATLSRENVYEIEDIMMDMKRELFQAEKRGRGEATDYSKGKTEQKHHA